MNKVTLLGYLSNEPDVKTFDSKVNSEESMLARVTIAVNDIRNRNVSYFITCVGWNQNAQYISQKLHKGDFVAIDGRLTNRSYVNSEGRKVYVTEVVIDTIRNYGSKKNDSEQGIDNETSEGENSADDFVVIDKTNNDDWENDLN